MRFLQLLSAALCVVSQLTLRCEAVVGHGGQRRYKIDLLRNESIEEETRVIRVAASSSMYWSDTFVRYCRDIIRGWDMFARWLNEERGGIRLNAKSYSIVFDFIQDYSNNTLVTKVYNSLLKDFDLFFAPYSSGLSNSAADITDPAGKLLLSVGASSTAVFTNRRSSFTTLPPNLEYLDSSFAALAAYGSKTVAVIKDLDYAGCGNPHDSNASAIKAGLTLYKHYDVDPSGPFYSNRIGHIIEELKAHGVETLLGCTYLSLCYEIVNRSKALDYNPQGIVLSTCLDSPDFLNWAGKNARGLMMPTVWEKSVEFIDRYTGWTPIQFDEKFTEAYGFSPNYYAVSAFSAGEILMDAIEKSQSLDPLVLADTLRSSYFETIYTNVSFDSNNQITAGLLIVQSQNDLTYTTVYPKYSEAIYPLPTWKLKQCEIDTNDCSGHGKCSSDGTCICDDQYYGKINVESCDTYCDGERAYDPGRDVYFCKSTTTLYVGAVTIAGKAQEAEHRAVLRLAADLINNKTDGYLDNTTAQVFFQIVEDRWECSSGKGSAYLEDLDLSVQNMTGSVDSGLSAVIEPDCSPVSESAASYGDRHAILQLAFGSTSVTLSDKTSYPLFARTCPSDAEQSQIIVDLLYYYGLKNIAVVSISDDVYSSSLASMIISKYLDRDGETGNVLRHESYPAGSGSRNASFYDAMLDRLASYGAAATVITAKSVEVQPIFDAVKRHHVMSSDRYLWVGPSDWVSSNVSNVPLGSLGVTIYSLNATGSMASKFMSLWRSLDPSEYPDLDGDRSTLALYSSFAVDAMFALALGFQQTINSNFVGSSEALRQDVYERLVDSVEFDGVSGLVRLNANGDREGSVYQIRNYQGSNNWAIVGYSDPENTLHFDSSVVWPNGNMGAAQGSAYSLQYEPECPAGSEPRIKDGLYYCSLCEVGHYKSSVGNEECSTCPEGTDCDDVGIAVPCILEGYWRPQPPAGEEGDFKKWPAFRCDVAKRCLGGCDLGATCAANMVQASPVCGVCMEGYYGQGEACTECPSGQSDIKAAEITLLTLVILAVFCLLIGLYAFFIHSITDINVFVVEKGTAASRQDVQHYDSVIAEKRSSERSSLKRKILDSIAIVPRFLGSLKSHGLFVTAKLTISFVQVLLGTLPRLDLDIHTGSSSSLVVFSIDLNPMNYVPILSECTLNNTLDRPFVHILLVLFLPAMFVIMIFAVRLLMMHLMRRNAPSLLSSSAAVVDRAMFDVTLKAIVWFCLFSFPLLASGTLSFFDCRDMGEIGVYMREDYSVRCDNNPSYSNFLAVAAVCVLLYPIGIPLFFYRLIRGRHEGWARVGSNALHMNFLPNWAYFEVFELFRKLMLTSVVAFVMPGTATQAMYLFMVDMMALLVLVTCRPYAADPDDFLSAMLVLTECTLFFIAFLIVSEVYTVDKYSKMAMINTCFSLIIVAFAFFVPMNMIAKIPAAHRVVETSSDLVTAQLSKLGIQVSRMWMLDARSRYQHEIEELQESIHELRLSRAPAERPSAYLSKDDDEDVGDDDNHDAWDRKEKLAVSHLPSLSEPRDGFDEGVTAEDPCTNPLIDSAGVELLHVNRQGGRNL